MSSSTDTETRFAAWMARVDRILITRAGVESADLADRCWRDEFDGGLTPREAVAEALADEGFDF